MIKVIPLRAFLLVEPLEQPTKSTILTVIAKDEQPQRGDVVRVGEKVKDLAPGDRVLFNRAMAIKTGVGDSLLVPEDSVYLTITMSFDSLSEAIADTDRVEFDG